MTGPGISFGGLRRRRPPALVDPATKNLTLYLAQRGDALDYTTATGTWTGRPSAGPSGGRNLTQPTAGSRPAVSPTVDGKALVRKVFADGKAFAALSAVSTYWDAGAAAAVILVRMSAPLNSNYGVGSGYPTPAIANDAAAYQGIGMGRSVSDPSKVRAGIGRYDGGWKVAATDNIASGVLVALCMRHAGGQLQFAVNAAPGPSNQVACGNAQNMASALNLITSTSIEADFASAYLAKSLSDTDFADILAWEHAQFPTGFP